MSMVLGKVAIGDTGNWAIVEAVGTAVTAALALIAGIVATRYLRRADATVEAGRFDRQGGVALHVHPCISSSGAIRLRLDRSSPDYSPQVVVTPVRVQAGQEVSGTPLQKICFVRDEIVDPGESLAGSETFLLPTPAADLLGWRVEFLFAAKRRIPMGVTLSVRWWPPPWLRFRLVTSHWWWVAQDFVPAQGQEAH